MGIKNYLNNLLKISSNIIVNKPDTIDVLCIDMNTILHEICAKSINNSQFRQFLFTKLDILLKLLKPRSIALFTDGQAVLAKAKTQIKRRNKYLYQDSNTISSLNLTPGTLFMDFVDELLLEYLNKLKIKSYYSSSTIHNEGELKLFSWIKKNYNDQTICIVGNDSDLIVIALINTPLLNLYIYNNKRFISLFHIVKSLSKFSEIKFNFKYHPIRKDIALISLLLGNDYNTHLANFKDLIKSYKILLSKKQGFLIKKNGEINLKNFRFLLENIPIKDKTIYTKSDVNNYFTSIIWNIWLYNGYTIPDYIPDYNINILTILKYYPYKIINPSKNNSWLDKDVFLLLLMPIIGKKLIPNRLQKYMDENSPIKDLFPDPCHICINFKKQINDLNSQINTLEDMQFKLLFTKVNEDYKQHINDKHSIDTLPIIRIQKTLNNLVKF